jgi:hypothetical protein
MPCMRPGGRGEVRRTEGKRLLTEEVVDRGRDVRPVIARGFAGGVGVLDAEVAMGEAEKHVETSGAGERRVGILPEWRYGASLKGVRKHVLPLFVTPLGGGDG